MRSLPGALRRSRTVAGAGQRSRPPRLVTRFAAYTAIVLALAGVAILLFARSYARTRAERAVRFHADFVSETILRDRLRPTDFARPVGARRRAQLDRLFHREVLVGGVVRGKLYAPDGQVTYSTDHDLIGARARSDDVRAALAGQMASDVSSLADEGSGGPDTKVLEAYVPFRFGDARPQVGVFELYQDYGPVASAARSAYLPVALVLIAILLALYLSLFPILRRTTRRLQQQMAEISHQALHDALTGLPNRELFRDRIEHAVAIDRRDGRPTAVLLLDLDRFKEVNDTLGHGSGDLLLEEVGRVLGSLVRDSDTVARLGGDEFGVVAPNTDVAGALTLAAKLQAGLARPMFVAELELAVDASIGVAVQPHHGSSAETLVRHADVALYVAKESHEPALYVPDHDHHSRQRLALVTGLRHALVAGELVVHYQPQADVETGSIRSVEALVRWQHPEHGLLGPDAFIPVAEHTGLIRPLTRHVLRTALEQARAWHAEGLDVAVAVNVTARDLLDLQFPEEVAGSLQRCGVPPARLELEITENTILTDPIRARLVLDRLSALGVTLAIDDFGSGHSSLGYLKRLPVDVLKIDRSFVLNMADDENDAVIVRSTIDLGHNLGLRVVAEGVEDRRAWHTLLDLRCDIAQGYLVGRPAPAAAVTELLRASRPLDTDEISPSAATG